MSEKEGGTKTWVTVITVVVPVLSAIVVAVLSQQTNIRLAEMERDTKASAIAIEQSKLREQQEERRQKFMIEHLPKLLSANGTDRQLGRALLFLNYPNEASDILQQILPAASGEVRQSLEAVQREAKEVQRETGDWAIVISGDKMIDPAKWEINKANKLNYKPVSLYLRDGYYRTVVGSYPNRQLAEQAALAIRPQTRSDAYVVALGRWCPSVTTKTEGDQQLLVCGNNS